MHLWAYVLKSDSGFAPNPLGGYCSLACCKPKIRKAAQPGDWIMGTTPADLGKGRLTYLMKVDEALTFHEYFCDPRFEGKKPSPDNPHGDNIYHWNTEGRMCQVPNPHHGISQMKRDLSEDRVLIGTEFVYFGRNAITIPPEFSSLVYQFVGQKKHPESDLTRGLICWVMDNRTPGIHGIPFR